MDHLPYFSVIIPTLNEELYIPNLLTDLTHQKVFNFEVIVVDGKSSDKTKLIVGLFKNKLPLTFLESSKSNVSLQRNMGAKLSR